MTGTEIFAVIGGVLAWALSVGMGIHALRKARFSHRVTASTDEAATLLEEPEE